MTDDDDDESFNLVMPFVLCTSAGGPFEDAAFVAGATCGMLMKELEACALLRATPAARYIDAPLIPQADLIAMQHGYKLTSGDLVEASGWQWAEFALAEEPLES